MREIILIQVSGSDRPGLTAAFTRILARYRLNILDIGQAVIHDTLSLGILVETPKDADSSAVLKDVLFEAHKLNITVRFRPIDEDRYEDWVAGQGKDRHINHPAGPARSPPSNCPTSPPQWRTTA